MRNVQDILDDAARATGTVPLPSDRYEGLLRRRDRKQRNKRVGTALLALAIAVAATAGVLRAFDTNPMPASPSGAWTRVENGNFPGRRVLVSLTIWRDSYIGVGEEGWLGHGVLLTSTDAVHWSASADSPHDELSGIIAAGSRLFAVGKDDLWVSEDGHAWTPATLEGIVWKSWRLHGIIAGGPGYLAIGPDGPGSGMWASADGLTWSHVPDERVFDGAYLSGLIAGGPGFVVSGQDREGSAGVWTSVDGISWAEVGRQPSLRGGRFSTGMGSVVRTDTGLLAVGGTELHGDSSTEGETAIVWTSPDGLTWTRVHGNERSFAHATLGYVIRTGSGFVATGNSASSGATIWASSDGKTWTRVSGDFSCPSPHMDSVIVGPAGLIAIGGNGADNCVWTTAPVTER